MLFPLGSFPISAAQEFTNSTGTYLQDGDTVTLQTWANGTAYTPPLPPQPPSFVQLDENDYQVGYDLQYFEPMAYTLVESGNTISIINKGVSGVYDKNTCSISIFDADMENELSKESWTVHQADWGSDNWSNISVNNAACETGFVNDNDTATIQAVKQNDDGIFVVTYVFDMYGVKTTVSYTNHDQSTFGGFFNGEIYGSPAKFGFVQSFADLQINVPIDDGFTVGGNDFTFDQDNNYEYLFLDSSRLLWGINNDGPNIYIDFKNVKSPTQYGSSQVIDPHITAHPNPPTNLDADQTELLKIDLDWDAGSDTTEERDTTYDGTNNGATSGVTGIIGNAWDFDGSNDYVTFPDFDIGTGAYSWNIWISLDDYSGNKGIMSLGCWSGGCSAGAMENLIHQGATDYLKGTSGSGTLTSDPFTLTNTDWTMVTLTRDASGDQNWYINGASKDTNTDTTDPSINDPSNLFYLGRAHPSDSTFNGKIDSFTMWSGKELSQTDIDYLYNTSSGIAFTNSNFPSGAELHFDFEDSTLNNQTTETVNLDDPTGYRVYEVTTGTGTVASDYTENFDDDTDWTFQDSCAEISGGVLDWSCDNGSNTTISTDFDNALSDDWVLRMKYTHTELVGSITSGMHLRDSDPTGQGWTGSSEFFGIRFNDNDKLYSEVGYDCNPDCVFTPRDSTDTLTDGTTYYLQLTLDRTAEEMVLEVYDDDTYTTQSLSDPTSTADLTTLNNHVFTALNPPEHISFISCPTYWGCGSSSWYLDAEVDDIQIWDDTTTTQGQVTTNTVLISNTGSTDTDYQVTQTLGTTTSTGQVALENGAKDHFDDGGSGGTTIGDPYDSSYSWASSPYYSPRYMGQQFHSGHELVGVEFNQIKWGLDTTGTPSNIDGTMHIKVYSESTYGEGTPSTWEWTSNTGVDSDTLGTDFDGYMFGDGTQTAYTIQADDVIFIVMDDNTHNASHYVQTPTDSNGYGCGSGGANDCRLIEWNGSEGWQNQGGDLFFVLYNEGEIVTTVLESFDSGDIDEEFTYKVSALTATEESDLSDSTSWTLKDDLAQPTNLTAQSGIPIVLDWDDVSNVVTYNVYRDDFTTPYATGVTSSTYSDSSASAGTTYEYKVAALGPTPANNLIGPLSSGVSGTGGVSPDPPTSLTATITDSTNSPLDVDLSWTTPGDLGTGTLSGYKIVRDSVVVHTTSGSGTTYTDTLSSTGTFSYTVRAVTNHGDSTDSNSASVTTVNPPSAISDLAATVITDVRIDLAWSEPSTDNPITNYYIFRDSTNIQNTTSTSYSDTGLTSNTEYYYNVFGVSNVGTSANSNTETKTTYTTVSGSISTSTQLNGVALLIDPTLSISGTPTPTFTEIKIYDDGVYHSTQAMGNADCGSVSDCVIYHFDDGEQHSIVITATDPTHWDTPTIESAAILATPEYEPTWDSNNVAYNVTRNTTTMELIVNRDIPVGWDLTCEYQTAAQAMTKTTGTQGIMNDGYYFENEGSSAITVGSGEHVYVSCTEDDDTVLVFTSYGPNVLQSGINLFNIHMEDYLGVESAAILFVVFAASLFGGRSAPTGILVVLALIGVLGFVGFMTIEEATWGIIMLCGVCGLFIGKRFL